MPAAKFQILRKCSVCGNEFIAKTIEKIKKRKEAQLIELHLFSYGCLSLFIDNYFTSSKSAS